MYPAAPKEDERALPELPRGAGKDWSLRAEAAPPSAAGAQQKMA